MQYCYTSGKLTNCTDSCRECAKEAYDELKAKVGKAEHVAEEAIRAELGDGTFELLREFGHIEFCGVINGTRRYAI